MIGLDVLRSNEALARAVTIENECRSCRNGVLVFAQACAHCGAPNAARMAGRAIVGALAVCALAVLTALVVIIAGIRLPAAAPADIPEGQEAIAAGGEDLAWLSGAMDTCEAAAEKDNDTLRFLIIPLAPSPADNEQWRSKPLNEGGNAQLLGSQDAMEGLKDGTLKLYRGEYDFRVLDEATNVVYRWKPGGGVMGFSTTDSGAIALFNVQFRTPRHSADPGWGTSFVRQSGTCYWVSAVIDH